jgi:hypothetical protein
MKLKNIDIWLFYSIVPLLFFYGTYIRLTCEELGCLAVIVPVIFIMTLVFLELIINLAIFLIKKELSLQRRYALLISGTLAMISLGFIIYANIR